MTEIQHELIMPNKDLPFKTLAQIDRDLCGLSGNAGVLFKRSGVFTGMWRFYYCQFQRSAFHSCTKRKYDCCAPDAA